MKGHQYLILFYASSYLFFLILLWISKEKKGLRLFDEKGLATNLPMLIVLQIAGIFLFGIIPLLFNHLGSFVLFNSATAGNPSTWITALLVILSLIISPRIMEKKFREFPDITSADTSPGITFYLAYFFIRIVFISVYECWFRGYLLTDSIISFGFIWAILLNICLYALLHLVNGKDEVIAGFPYGFLLCCLCIWQGAVWPAVVIHLALTVPYELGYLRKIKAKLSLQV